MRNLIPALLITLCSGPFVIAQNLVPNNGFDVYTICPSSSSQFTLTPPWDNVGNVSGSPDYMNACFGGNQGVPSNFYGYQVPVSGNGYYGVITFYNGQEVREYLSVPLTCTLFAGVEYEVGFHVSHSDNFRFATDRFGAYFSDGPLSGTGNSDALPYTPQIDNPPGNLLTDNTGWTLISGTFVATGTENQLTIGNFHDDNETQTLIIDQNSSLQWAYYYVDEVYVIPVNGGSLMANDTTLCTGDILELDVTILDATYLWQDGSTEATHSVSDPGTYWVQMTLGDCVITDTIAVSFTPPPSIGLGNDTTICSSDTLLLDVTTPGASYTWHDGSMDPTFIVDGPGSYWVEVLLDGCSASDTMIVSGTGSPGNLFGNDTTLCPGSTLALDVATGDATYLWQDGSTASTYLIGSPGTYWVQIELGQCILSDTIDVDYTDLPEVHLGNDTTLCEGSSLTLDATIANGSYIWQDGSELSSLPITADGLYWVQVSVGECSTSDTIQVTFSNMPEFTIGNDTTICNGALLVIDASLLDDAIEWSSGSNEAFITVGSPGTYWVQGLLNSCLVADTMTVDLFDCDPDFEMPNIFSPNGDGMNDRFGTLGGIRIDNALMNIYGRWGGLLYTTTDISTGWNGNTNGGPCADGTYFWVVEYGSTEKRVKHGHVTLLR